MSAQAMNPATSRGRKGFPMISFARIPTGVGSSAWCRGCSTLGYAFDDVAEESFRRRHAKCADREG